jgi:hypothetical protein
MRIVKYLSLFILIVLFSGCATPRLGYPVKTVEIPTRVTLFSTIAKDGILNNNMSIMSRDLFNGIYRKKYEEMLREMPLGTFQSQLDDLFLTYALKASDLFSISPVHVYNWDIDGHKPKDDKKALYNHSFHMYKDQIESEYVLALTIDEWGYNVEQSTEEDGPFMSITIQLYNKETNESLWGYNSLFHESTGKEGHSVITYEDIKSVYETLIERAVRRYFSRLSKK